MFEIPVQLSAGWDIYPRARPSRGDRQITIALEVHGAWANAAERRIVVFDGMWASFTPVPTAFSILPT